MSLLGSVVRPEARSPQNQLCRGELPCTEGSRVYTCIYLRRCQKDVNQPKKGVYPGGELRNQMDGNGVRPGELGTSHIIVIFKPCDLAPSQIVVLN